MTWGLPHQVSLKILLMTLQMAGDPPLSGMFCGNVDISLIVLPRSLQRTRSLSLQSTPSLATPTSVNRPLHFDLYHTLSSKSSHLNSPLLAATPPQDRPHTHTATPLHGRPLSSTNHTVTAVLRQMSQLLDWRECMLYPSCHMYVHITCMSTSHA